MDNKLKIIAILTVTLATVHLGMSRHGQYDEEARETEKIEREMKKNDTSPKTNKTKNFATGIKEVTYDSTKDLLEETAEATADEPPIVGTLEGIRLGSGKVLDNAVKGAVKIATLGYKSGEGYEIEEPEKGSGDVTKIKFAF